MGGDDLRLLERPEVAPLGLGQEDRLDVGEVLAQVLEGVPERRVLGAHERHRRLDLCDAVEREAPDMPVVLGQRRLLQQAQQRLRVARQTLERPPLLRQVDGRVDQVAQVRAPLGRDLVARALERRDPVAPARPAVVCAQVLQRRQRGLDCDDLADALGMAGGEVERDVRAVAVADERRPLELEPVEQPEQVVRHVVGAVAGRRRAAVAVPAQVVGQDAEAVGQRGHELQVPDGEVAGDAVNHHHVRAVADLLVVEGETAVED